MHLRLAILLVATPVLLAGCLNAPKAQVEPDRQLEFDRQFAVLHPAALRAAADRAENVTIPFGGVPYVVHLEHSTIYAPGCLSMTDNGSYEPCHDDGRFFKGFLVGHENATVSLVLNTTTVEGFSYLPDSPWSSTVQACGPLVDDGSRVHVFYNNTWRGGDPCSGYQAFSNKYTDL
ncbi:MAG: hypothetical protein WDA16_05665 [Candidatus Thermoplasmatota archaeon]